MPDLDHLLKRLAATPPDRRLDGLEARVWARIEARRTPAPSPVPSLRSPLPWAAAALALFIGIATSMLVIPAPNIGSDMAAFSSHAPLAPSTLLDRRS